MISANHVILIIALSLIGIIILRRLIKPSSWAAGSERETLIRMCFGDSDAADRLMQFELERDPNINQREAYRRAVERYKRHNQ